MVSWLLRAGLAASAALGAVTAASVTPGTAAPSAVGWLPTGLVVGAAVGLVATLAMDVPMAYLPEGTTPTSVAAGTLSDRPLDRTPAGVATAVHYAAGVGTGVLLVAGVVAARSLVDAGPALVVPAVAVGLYALMNWFFSFLVLPAYGRVPAERVRRVRRDWAIAAAAYLLVAGALVGAALTVA